MEKKALFDRSDREGRLRIPGEETAFRDLPWTKHPSFESVELKAIVSGKQTDGRFSYHLVRIALNRTIRKHVHQTQVETHAITAGDSGLYLFAKFIPVLN